LREISSHQPVKEEKAQKPNLNKKSKTLKHEEKEYTHTVSLNLEKFIYDMLKQKIETHKKTSNVKLDMKNTKDPNILKLEIKAFDQKTFNNVYEDLYVIQKYLNLKINEKDKFLTDEKGPISLKHYLTIFKVNSYRIFKLDEENISLQLIGPEAGVKMVTNLVEEYVKSNAVVEQRKTEFEKMKI
jgi:hypothetical protein